jgi:hypothetical protein
LNLFLLWAGCASPLESYSGYVPPHEYAVPCFDAYLQAARALKANGYRISEVERGPEAGTVVGLREAERSRRMEIRIVCGPTGVSIFPSADSPYAENAMRIAFERAGELREGAARRGTELEVEAELVVDPETQLYFGGLLGPLGAVALRVTVANGTSRVVEVSPTAIGLRLATGDLQKPLGASEIERRLAPVVPGLAPLVLPAARLRSGESVAGFLFYPTGHYVGAVVPVIDVETGEPEEFETLFLQ